MVPLYRNPGEKKIKKNLYEYGQNEREETESREQTRDRWLPTLRGRKE